MNAHKAIRLLQRRLDYLERKIKVANVAGSGANSFDVDEATALEMAIGELSARASRPESKEG